MTNLSEDSSLLSMLSYTTNRSSFSAPILIVSICDGVKFKVFCVAVIWPAYLPLKKYSIFLIGKTPDVFIVTLIFSLLPYWSLIFTKPADMFGNFSGVCTSSKPSGFGGGTTEVSPCDVAHFITANSHEAYCGSFCGSWGDGPRGSFLSTQ